MLEQHLKDLIKKNGPLTIEQFMKIVVPYYYENNIPIGARGDFITAPEISQMFGEVIGVWCAYNWIQKGKGRFNLLEMGPGNGTMMLDIMRATKNIEDFHNSINRIYLLENSKSLIQKQLTVLQDYKEKIQHISSLEEIPIAPIIILANEFFDAIPMRQFLNTNDKTFEVHIDIKDEEFIFQHLESNQVIPNNSFIEISEQTNVIANTLIKILQNEKSFGLIIDYGYWERPNTPTIQALKKHKYINVLKDIGQADITYLVDFKNLHTLFTQQGIKCIFSTQKQFLTENGIHMRASRLIENGAEESQIASDLNRLLFDMGNLFKVLQIGIK